MIKKTLTTSVCLMAASCLSFGQSGITIPNYGFENITGSVSAPSALGVTVVGTNSTSLGAWTATAGASLAGLGLMTVSSGTAASLSGPTPTQGSYEAKIAVPTGVGSIGSLSQSLSTAFVPNSYYSLSLDLCYSTTASVLSQSTLSLLAGSTAVASYSGTGLSGLLGPSGTFQTITLGYTTGATAPTGNIGISLGVNSVAGLSGNVFLDNAQLTITPVPEPSAGVVFGSGIGLVLAFNRFRNKVR